MARAETASASLRSDSIQGLAKSIAKPAYRRLLSAEPLLRRAVPALIIAFLVTICVGALVQVIDQTRQKQVMTKHDLLALADLLAEQLEHAGVVDQKRPASIERLQNLLPKLIPSWGVAAGRHVIVTGADQRVLARVPIGTGSGESDRIFELISITQSPALRGTSPASVADILLLDGSSALAVQRVVRS